jgi:hypothetical protein
MKKIINKTVKKEFDAVKMMRSIRDDLSFRWLNDPEIMKKDLEKTRKDFSRYFK